MMKPRSITLPIGGRHCCRAGARIVERALAQVAGVCSVEANAATGTVYVEYDPTVADSDQLRVAIEASGFGPARPAGHRHRQRELLTAHDRRSLPRAPFGGAVLVWVLIIAAAGLILRGTPSFGLLLIVGTGAVYFVVLGFLFRGR